jgi:hypothetical protein
MSKRLCTVFERIAPIVQKLTRSRANPVLFGKAPLPGLVSAAFPSLTYRAKNGSSKSFRQKTGSKLVAEKPRKGSSYHPLVATALIPAAVFFVSPDPAQGKIHCSGESVTWQTHWSWAKKLKGKYRLPGWARDKHRFSVVCADTWIDRRRMKRNWQRVKKTILPPRHDLWIRIGRCEQPGRGYRGINWSHTGPTYQGGLGFWYGTWSGFKYRGMPSNAGYATWRQQMKVANRLYRLYGTRPWGCA